MSINEKEIKLVDQWGIRRVANIAIVYKNNNTIKIIALCLRVELKSDYMNPDTSFPSCVTLSYIFYHTKLLLPQL